MLHIPNRSDVIPLIRLPSLPRATVILVVFCLLSSLAARSQSPEVGHRKLIVGTKQAAPFAMKEPDGTWIGISIDLWREIASELHLNYEFHETDQQGLITGVQDGSLDVAIAAISITADREKLFDFTHPYYYSGLGIAVRPKQTSDWMDTLKHFLSWDVLRLIVILMASIMIFGTLIWLLERKRNPQQFGGTWRDGIGSGFWWSAVTLTTVGYGDKTPMTLWGRLLALIWMFSAIIIVASFTATVTTTMTIAQLEPSIKGPDDLVGARVGAIGSTTSEAYIRGRDIIGKSYKTPVDGLKELETGKIDAMVYDAPILSYWTHQRFSNNVTVLPITFEKQNYGIALPTGSPLRKPINQVILQKLRSEGWQELLRRYLGEQY